MKLIVNLVSGYLRHLFGCICLLCACVCFAEDPVNGPMGSMKSRDHYIIFYSSEQGLRYTVKDLKGKTLAEKIEEKKLISQFPQLEPIIRGYADDASLSPNQDKNMDILNPDP